MTTKQTVASLAAIGALGLASVVGVQSVSAHQAESGSPMSSLVEEIAQKFNLNQSDVQAVFDDHRNQMHDQMESRLENRLQQAVDSGQLSAEQKTKIMAKMEELHNQRLQEREAMQGLSAEERQQLMELHHQELEAWAQDNNIPLEFLSAGFGHGEHHRGLSQRGMMH